MFQVSRTIATTSTTRIALALAAATALSAGAVGSATASPVPDPPVAHTSQVAWQDTLNEIAAEARNTNSLARRRMLHAEWTIVMHTHHDG